MKILNWLLGRENPAPISQPIVTVGMDSDAWLEEMLEVIEEKEFIRKERQRSPR